MKFRPSLVPTVFMVAGSLFLASLGSWQVGRLKDADAERAAYVERLAMPAFDAADPPAEPALRRVRATGTPLWERYFLIGGKYMWSQPGYHLIVPVATPSGRYVLVNTGWIPIDEVEPILARERAVEGPRTYEGLARVYEEDAAAAAKYPLDDGYQRKWRVLSPRALGAAAGIEVPSFVVIDGQGLALDADILDREPPVSGWRTEPQLRPHAQYAFTWFSLACTLVLVWVSASVKTDPRPE